MLGMVGLGWFQRGVASLRLDSPAQLRSVREEREDEQDSGEDEQDSGEGDQYQEALRAEAEQEQEPPRLATENPELSRSLRSKTMGALLGQPSTQSDENSR